MTSTCCAPVLVQVVPGVVTRSIVRPSTGPGRWRAGWSACPFCGRNVTGSSAVGGTACQHKVMIEPLAYCRLMSAMMSRPGSDGILVARRGKTKILPVNRRRLALGRGGGAGGSVVRVRDNYAGRSVCAGRKCRGYSSTTPRLPATRLASRRLEGDCTRRKTGRGRGR